MNDPRLTALGDTPGSDGCGCMRASEPPNTEAAVEQQWWRVLYSNGSERIAGPWFPTKEEASEWALDSPLVSKRAMRSIRYEADVRNEPL